MSFVNTKEQARRAAEGQGGAVGFGMKRERFDALGIGLGLTDLQLANLDVGHGLKPHRLIQTECDPADPERVWTLWRPA